MLDLAFWIRVGAVVAAVAVGVAIALYRRRRVLRATLARPSLRRRPSSLPSGYRRLESRLAPLGFRTIGDFDLCDESGSRLHRFLISWSEEHSTLSLRGMRVGAFVTELTGHGVLPPAIVVQTSIFDVDHTHPRHVVQTVRGVKHGSERALLAVHDDAIALLQQEGWCDRRRHVDPVEFAATFLVENARAHSIGSKRRGIELGMAAHRTYRNGRAQVGAALERSDPGDLRDGLVDGGLGPDA